MLPHQTQRQGLLRLSGSQGLRGGGYSPPGWDWGCLGKSREGEAESIKDSLPQLPSGTRANEIPSAEAQGQELPLCLIPSLSQGNITLSVDAAAQRFFMQSIVVAFSIHSGVSEGWRVRS